MTNTQVVHIKTRLVCGDAGFGVVVFLLPKIVVRKLGFKYPG